MLDEGDRKRGRSGEKPGRFVDDMESLARGLPTAHLPWFWDTIGHWLLETHHRSAARAYGQARAAERDHLPHVDPDWRRANVLLFARFGALPATELSGHRTWLAGILDPGAAHREFVRLLATWAASPGAPPTWPAGLGTRPAPPVSAPRRKPGCWAGC